MLDLDRQLFNLRPDEEEEVKPPVEPPEDENPDEDNPIDDEEIPKDEE